jgi:hypothetical protein
VLSVSLAFVVNVVLVLLYMIAQNLCCSNTDSCSTCAQYIQCGIHLQHHCTRETPHCYNNYYYHTNAHTTLQYTHYICKQDGFIDGTDVKQVLGASAVAPLTAIKGRQGRITFAPPPGSDELFDNNSETAAGKKRRSKGGSGSSSDNAVIEWITDFCAHFLLGAIAGGIGASAVYPIGKSHTYKSYNHNIVQFC